MISFFVVGTNSFRLIACREDGTPETQTVELEWNTISRWESDEESMAFCFEYSRNGKSPRWVKVYTQYVSPRNFNLSLGFQQCNNCFVLFSSIPNFSMLI